MEPILEEDPDRFCLFPIKHHDLWEAYQTHQKAYWKAEEIDFSKDRTDFESLTEDEQHFIENVLGFFATADGIVNENIVENLCSIVQYPEARFFYGFQIMMENIHSHVYSLQIESIIPEYDRRMALFSAIKDVPCIKKKAEWALRWLTNKECSLAERLVAFAVVEGVLFSGSFCAVYWLQERGIMPGLTFSNQFIARDEGLHTKFAVLLYNNHIVNKLSTKEIHEIVRSGVETEIEFVREALKCDLIGMNSRLMVEYVKYVADGLLDMLKVPMLYNVENPFEFMERISIEGKTNFFEHRVSEYKDPFAGGKERVFTLDEEF